MLAAVLIGFGAYAIFGLENYVIGIIIIVVGVILIDWK